MSGFPSVTQVIQQVYRGFDHIPPDVLAAACARGDEVHRLCALYAKGLWIDEVAPEYAGYFQSFQKWFDKYVVAVHLVEERLTDEGLRFTGEPDFIFTLRGDSGKSLVDLKTPQVGTRAWRLQLSAYRHLAVNGGHEIIRVFALRPRPDGKLPTIPPKYEYTGTVLHDFEFFKSALNVWRFLNA
jgi:hypothetical protein